MDRSLLCQKNVIEASRGLICLRLATYENAAEVKYLEKVFRGGSGQLENTVFAMLSPSAPSRTRGTTPAQHIDDLPTPESLATSTNDS